ncbi:glycosyltransferase family 4 protein [Corynebacterium mayonis]|uniref:glycosyltransferase family 4 protein n=1 Tax=Corynebacterium mayonis TaxID=3062461 RepID=UPI00313FE21C
MTSVIRGRAASERQTQFDVVFYNDRGGLSSFRDMDNINVRIVREDRAISFLKYLVTRVDYEEINILSSPKIANALAEDDGLAITYEFHSSNMTVIENEMSVLDFDRLSSILVPSVMMQEKVADLLPRRVRRRLFVCPNLVDHGLFSPQGVSDFFAHDETLSSAGLKPLVWVGRFDRDKGYQYAIRALAQLPTNYVGVFVVSLEHDPLRANRFFSECDAMGVRDRVLLYMNLSQPDMANLYRSARDAGGAYLSTSLMESFGYSIAESLSCGLSCVSFDLPVLDMHEGRGNLHRVPIGDVQSFADAVRTL